MSKNRLCWRYSQRKLKELLREPRESFRHLAPSPTKRAISTKRNVQEWLPPGAEFYSSSGTPFSLKEPLGQTAPLD